MSRERTALSYLTSLQGGLAGDGAGTDAGGDIPGGDFLVVKPIAAANHKNVHFIVDAVDLINGRGVANIAQRVDPAGEGPALRGSSPNEAIGSGHPATSIEGEKANFSEGTTFAVDRNRAVALITVCPTQGRVAARALVVNLGTVARQRGIASPNDESEAVTAVGNDEVKIGSGSAGAGLADGGTVLENLDHTGVLTHFCLAASRENRDAGVPPRAVELDAPNLRGGHEPIIGVGDGAVDGVAVSSNQRRRRTLGEGSGGEEEKSRRTRYE